MSTCCVFSHNTPAPLSHKPLRWTALCLLLDT
jgi:hypothetical protein